MPRFLRPPRRPLRPLAAVRRRAFRPPRPLPPGPVLALAEAHRLMAQGQFAPAAEKFENIAEAARAQDLPFAPRLFFQAARANWSAGRIPHGMQLLHDGLGILAAAGATKRMHQISAAAAEELEALGHTAEAEEIRRYLAQFPSPAESGAAASAAEMPAAAVHPILPANCPKCGGGIRSEEVEWIDAQTAECAYCGSPIRPEKG
ncbi:MAG: hypothetical protein JW929_03200 [Anaerolineales bacterium]|nr:hypothetical protein [Anaerolineales bacterium]